VHRDLDDIEPVEFGLEKVIARRAAAELQVDAVVIHALGRKIIVRNGRVTGLDMVITGKPGYGDRPGPSGDVLQASQRRCVARLTSHS
jgi:hypothetical protein